MVGSCTGVRLHHGCSTSRTGQRMAARRGNAQSHDPVRRRFLQICIHMMDGTVRVSTHRPTASRLFYPASIFDLLSSIFYPRSSIFNLLSSIFYPRSSRGYLSVLSLTLLFAPACRQDMHDQPRYEALEPSTFFAD